MANLRSKIAIGISKKYYEVENEFEAVGTLFATWNMYYTAAHPTMGLWLAESAMDNTAIVIGFVQWSNIKRVLVDTGNENVYIVLDDYDTAISDADTSFKMIYKKTFTHQMSDTGELSLVFPLDLFSGNIIPYLETKVCVEYGKEDVKTNIWMTILYILILGGVIISAISKYI